jgi:hypothetical protein
MTRKNVKKRFKKIDIEISEINDYDVKNWSSNSIFQFIHEKTSNQY